VQDENTTAGPATGPLRHPHVGRHRTEKAGASGPTRPPRRAAASSLELPAEDTFLTGGRPLRPWDCRPETPSWPEAAGLRAGRSV